MDSKPDGPAADLTEDPLQFTGTAESSQSLQPVWQKKSTRGEHDFEVFVKMGDFWPT
jgi:hypothetical protein